MEFNARMAQTAWSDTGNSQQEWINQHPLIASSFDCLICLFSHDFSSMGKGRQNILFSPSVSRQCPYASQEGSRLHYTKLFGNANIANNKWPPLPSSFLFVFIAKQASYGMIYPFGQFCPDVLAKLAPKVLLTASLVLLGGSSGEMALMESCPAAAKTFVCSHTFLPTQPSTVQDAIGKIISIQPELQNPSISLPLASPLNIKSWSALAWKWLFK